MDRVRRARSADRAAATATVSAAFARDPAWSYLFGDEYDRLAPHFAGALFDLRVGSGDVWVSDDLAALAMWEQLGGHRSSGASSAVVWNEYRAVAGAEPWQRLVEYERAVDAARPSTPYWYLGVLATHPERRSQGLATAVMARVLEGADRDGVDCCLETSTSQNREFYERRGFTEATAIHIASGPPTWWLRRAPRRPS